METKNIAKTDVPIRKLLWVQVVFSWSISGSWRFINFHPQCHQGTKGGLGGSDFDQCYPFTRNHAAMQLQDSPNQLDFISIIWVWVNTYRYIFSGMNIHYQLFWGSLGTRVFDPSPFHSLIHHDFFTFGNCATTHPTSAASMALGVIADLPTGTRWDTQPNTR